MTGAILRNLALVVAIPLMILLCGTVDRKLLAEFFCVDTLDVENEIYK